MNYERRKLLKNEALVFLNKARANIAYVLQLEEISLENVPENLQNSEIYENIEFAIDSLENCINKLDDITDELQDIVA